LKPFDKTEEEEKFRPFDRIVGKRNRIFKANDLGVNQDEVEDMIACVIQVLDWELNLEI